MDLVLLLRIKITNIFIHPSIHTKNTKPFAPIPDYLEIIRQIVMELLLNWQTNSIKFPWPYYAYPHFWAHDFFLPSGFWYYVIARSYFFIRK